MQYTALQHQHLCTSHTASSKAYSVKTSGCCQWSSVGQVHPPVSHSWTALRARMAWQKHQGEGATPDHLYRNTAYAQKMRRVRRYTSIRGQRDGSRRGQNTLLEVVACLHKSHSKTLLFVLHDSLALMPETSFLQHRRLCTSQTTSSQAYLLKMNARCLHCPYALPLLIWLEQLMSQNPRETPQRAWR